MSWRDVVASWEQDPEFRDAYEKEYPYHAVADAIVALRGEFGLTQAELAEAARTTQSVIARLESGRQPVRIELLNRIAQAVGCTWRPRFEPIHANAPAISAEFAISGTTSYPTLDAVFDSGIFYDTNVVIETVRTQIGDVHIYPQGGWLTKPIGEPIASFEEPGHFFGEFAVRHVVRQSRSRKKAEPLAGNRQSTLALAS
jgi:transcriptional regulator with XRE-family HTH domain